MAVNKNFVVKNGLEVNTDLLFADSATRSVGVGSTSPNFDLDVRGGIGATDLRVTGFTTLTKDFQVGASGSAFYVSNTNNLVGVGTSVPAFLMDIRSSVSSGQTALYVKGDMRVTGDINLDDLTIDDLTVTGIATYKPDGSGGSPDSWIDIDYTGNTTTGGGTTVGFGSTAYFVDEAKVVFGAGEDLTIGHVGGLNVIGGAVKFNDTTQSSSKDTGSVILEGGAGIEKNLYVGGGAEVTGVATVTGTLDANGALTVAGTADFASDVDIDDTTQNQFNATTGALKVDGGVGIVKNLFVGGGAQVTGVTTITGTLDANGALDVDGHTELDDVNVAGASTFAGAVDINNSANISSGLVVTSGATLDSAQVSDLTDNSVVIAGASGELEDSADLTFDGTTLAIDAIIDSNDATESNSATSGSVQLAGGLGVVKNIYTSGGAFVTGSAGLTVSAGDVTVGSAVTIGVNGNAAFAGIVTVGGNLYVTGDIHYDEVTGRNLNISGIATFAEIGSNLIPDADGSRNIGAAGSEWQDLHIDGTANIDSLVADTAQVSDLTNTRVVYAGASGELSDDSTLTFNSTTKVLSVQELVGVHTSAGGGGVGIASTTAHVGYGFTYINFKGPGVSTVYASSTTGIATIFFQGGGSNAGAAGTWTPEGSIGISTSKSIGVNTTSISDADLQGIGNTFQGVYIGNGMLVTDNQLNGNHYIGTAYNGLMAGPVTVNGVLTVDGNWAVV